MKRIKAAFLLLMVYSTSLLLGCADAAGNVDSSAVQTESPIQIGITFDNFVVERWIRDRDVFVTTAEDSGAKVNVQNANGSVDEQIAQIEYFIKKNVDVIVIVAVDGDKLQSVVTKAETAGIKVVAYDRLIKNSDVDLYISFDNEEVGRLMGEALVSALPGGGNVFAVNGPTSDNNVLMVQKGFLEAIKSSRLKVVYTSYCDGWLSDLAFTSVNTGLKMTTDVDAVMCGNDDLASQAFRALAENRIADQVVLVGQDADLAACQRIVEGTQAMTVYKSVDELAKAAALYAVSLAKGQSLDISDTISDGMNDVPYYGLQPVAVTKANIDEVIIDGGFHLREDVYLNVKQ